MNTLTQIDQKAASRMTSNSLLNKRAELLRIVEEAQEVLAGVNTELMARVENEGVDGKLSVGRSTVSLVNRPVFKGVEMTTAMKLQATKLTLDTTKLAALLKAGKRVKGATYSSYITVR